MDYTRCRTLAASCMRHHYEDNPMAQQPGGGTAPRLIKKYPNRRLYDTETSTYITLADLPLAEWNALLAVNLTGYFLCAQVFGRQMRERGDGGSLIHVASIAADHATPFSGAYSVAKAGVAMLSRQLAIEWAEDRIRSNAVHPGMIRTPLSQAFYDEPGATERRAAVIPSGRIGEPQDIADAVLFLASPRSAYVNGDAITVDGGYVRNVMSLIPRAGYGPAPGPRA